MCLTIPVEQRKLVTGEQSHTSFSCIYCIYCIIHILIDNRNRFSGKKPESLRRTLQKLTLFKSEKLKNHRNQK